MFGLRKLFIFSHYFFDVSISHAGFSVRSSGTENIMAMLFRPFR